MRQGTILILKAIDAHKLSRWSAGSLAKQTNLDTKTIFNALNKLLKLRLVQHLKDVKGYRRWQTTAAWRRRSLEDIIEDYEWARRGRVFRDIDIRGTRRRVFQHQETSSQPQGD